jgi:hypothetical protein
MGPVSGFPSWGQKRGTGARRGAVDGSEADWRPLKPLGAGIGGNGGGAAVPCIWVAMEAAAVVWCRD